MRQELDFLVLVLSSPHLCDWSIPIRFLIPADPDATVLGDACTTGVGAFSPELGF